MLIAIAKAIIEPTNIAIDIATFFRASVLVFMAKAFSAFWKPLKNTIIDLPISLKASKGLDNMSISFPILVKAYTIPLPKAIVNILPKLKLLIFFLTPSKKLDTDSPNSPSPVFAFSKAVVIHPTNFSSKPFIKVTTLSKLNAGFMTVPQKSENAFFTLSNVKPSIVLTFSMNLLMLAPIEENHSFIE